MRQMMENRIEAKVRARYALCILHGYQNIFLSWQKYHQSIRIFTERVCLVRW